jgi:DNA-binding protein H-NS
MRLFLGCILSLALSVFTVSAAASNNNSSDAKSANTADSSPSSEATTAKPAASAEPAKSTLETEIEELRDLVQAQTQQLQAQSDQLKQQQEKMQSLEEQLKAAAPAKLALAPAPQPTSASGSSAGQPTSPLPTAGMPAASAPNPPTPPRQGPQKAETAPPSPLSFSIGSAQFTPGGFADLTNFFRSKDMGSGIGSSFNGIPFNNALPLAALTEDHFSLQNSRLLLRVDSKVAGGDVIGYVETDFLGFTNDNLNVTSNSTTLRDRLYFIDYRKGAFEFLGGQDWSILTPSRTGIAVMPADVFNTQDMDTNYQLGLTWERTPQFRITLHPSNTVAFAVAIENPQQYTGSAVTFPTTPIAFNTSQVNTGTSLNGAAIAASPATTTNSLATPDVAPDLIAKIAFDPHPPGHAIHLEAYGLFRTFRINTFTAAGSLGSTTIHGAAGSFNSNFEIFKNFKIYETAFYSAGGGREIGNTNVPDFIVTPAATTTSLLGLSPVHSDAGILGFEYQTTPKFMVYGYYGYVYIGRNYSLTGCGATGTSPCGYGFPGSANSNDRSLYEPTIGFIPTFWRNPNYGALSMITQFSYLNRDPWVVAANAPRNAHLFMAYVDLRYTLP